MSKRSMMILLGLLLTALIFTGCGGNGAAEVEEGEKEVEETGEVVEETTKMAEKFNYEIIGIDAGAEIMSTVEERVMTEYGLDEYELVDASEAAMIAEIESRGMVEEWVVAIGWTPHWKFPEYNLRFLEDPLGIFGEEENIKALGRAGLTEDMPEVAEVLSNFSLNDDQLGEMMMMIQEGEQGDREAMEAWAADHQELIESWIPEGADGEGATVQLLYNNWTCAIAKSNLMAYVLEEKMNYVVEKDMVDVAVLYESLASGDYDAMVSAWLPLTQSNYWANYGDKLEDLGNIYEGAKLGLVVPDYVTIDSIEEM
ncbi:glycine betaine ABC transporter substrate-binding protein [Tindallia californiensis]|uniref:Glycine betaine/proline transport system substrate-binding protein n=1 Tax=Tindallia californiensis TaxID=159292 RepID=A0A1H3PXG0_9FIRM|nr:glycine betaine ABC transporter substrate-binding protein [Tindallia californiensis]SDZ05079.1 glycine betaine/proline transport system substrate-binding protein [Tindallia californiensis]